MSSSSNNLLRAISGQFLKSNLNQLSQQSLQRIIPSSSIAVRKFTTFGSGCTSSSHTHSNNTHPSTSLTKPLHQPNTKFQSSNVSFSTAAQNEEEASTKTPTRKKRIFQRKDPLTITPAAADRIKELLESPNGKGAIGIRLGVKRRGCNGLSYTLNYAFEREAGEEEMEAHGVRVMVEPMALFNVVGTEMDWVVTDMSSEFTFENPNSKGECGCGESFNV